MRQRVFSQGNAGIAQLVEQLICNQQVVGSNPSAGSRLKYFPRSTYTSSASVVEKGSDRQLPLIAIIPREKACAFAGAGGSLPPAQLLP